MKKNIIKNAFIFVFSLCFILIHSVQAQNSELTSDSQLETMYFKSSSLFKYNIKIPENFDPKKKHTLVIGLHGFADNPDNFISIWDSVKGVDFIYACPQAPYTLKMGENIGYDWSLWMSKDRQWIKRASENTDNYISDLVVRLKEQFNIDDMYLLGFSQGAIFTYLVGIQNFQQYKGIISLSGSGILEPLLIPFIGESAPDWLEEKYLEPAKSLRVFIAHGKNDKAVNFQLALKSKKILVDYGYNVTFQSFDGGHTINPENLSLVSEWIKNIK